MAAAGKLAKPQSAFDELGRAETIKALCGDILELYLGDHVPWVVGYSGGKDSTAVLQLVWMAISKLSPDQRHKPIHVVSTDTLVEQPVVASWVDASHAKMRKAAAEQGLPVTPHKLTPEVKDSYWVNLIGKGYPAPRKKFRWCTERMKINPSNKFIREVVRDCGEAILVLGTRKAESQRRARTMKVHEKNRVRDWLSPNASLPNSLVYTPVEDWTNDDVWLFLMQVKNPWGHTNKSLLGMYQGASEDGECPLVVDTSTPSCGDSRFGCWVCTLVDKDRSMEAMIKNDDEKIWMTPLLELRNEIGNFKNERERRDYRRMNGRVQLFHDSTVPGPYKKQWRDHWLRRVLEVQQEIREIGPRGQNGKPKPITLFGGINGGGKMTLLDAVELALYGARARCARRSDGAYENFLHECIHRGVDPGEGASVGLSFRYTSEGEEHLYELRRSWSLRRKRLREDVVVYRDGVLNRAASDYWNELVQELIPIGLSQLFFFDAEKIRFLAEDDTGDATLGASIKSLLGLDLAERLITDTSVLESRLVERTELASSDSELKQLQAEFKEREEAVRSKKKDRAALEGYRLRAANELEKVEEEFANVGGNLWEKRESSQRRRTELTNRKKELECQLVALSGSELPFLLVPELLASVQGQDECEQTVREATIVGKLLAKRDTQMIRQLKQNGVASDAVEAVCELQRKDRESRKQASKISSRLKLSDAARTSLQHLQVRGLSERLDEANRLLDALDSVFRELEDAEHALKRTPEDSDVNDVVNRLKDATKKSAVLNDRADKLDAELKSLQFARDEVERKLQTLLRKQIDQQIRGEEAGRMVKLAIRTQSTMGEFLRRATAAKIDRLSGLVTDSFRFLLRKQTLVQTVHIDPETFAITLFDDHGQPIPKKRLSEGEKQIFAISVLWGLAQASPRPLPAIIDTPMARLDVEHRNNLIQRYFPNASHQVIILSTDTEVDQRYYKALQPHITRAYHLNYDESEKATQAEEGYFWEAQPVGAGPGE